MSVRNGRYSAAHAVFDHQIHVWVCYEVQFGIRIAIRAIMGLVALQFRVRSIILMLLLIQMANMSNLSLCQYILRPTPKRVRGVL